VDINSIDNAVNRWRWLDEILANNIPLNKDMQIHLKDMKSFCGFAVKGHFNPIAYNTLKAAMHDSSLSSQIFESTGNKWTAFLDKRKQAYLFLISRLNESKFQIKTKKDYELEVKQCLWHSHLCSLAYLELYRSITNYYREQISLPDIAKYQLEQIISESRIKFSEIISPQTPDQYFGKLSIIEGGRNEH